MEIWPLYLASTLLAILLQAYFSMMEMSCISCNKIKLECGISTKQSWALYLAYLLNRPSYFFSSILFGIHLCLQAGAESARVFYLSVGINPDYGILIHIMLVIMFAELLPLIIARDHANWIVKIGIFPIYFFSQLIKPLIFVLNKGITEIEKLLFGVHSKTKHLDREELKDIIAGDNLAKGQMEAILANIFSAKDRKVEEIIFPIDDLTVLPATYSVQEARMYMQNNYRDYFAINGKGLKVGDTASLMFFPDQALLTSIAVVPTKISYNSSLLSAIVHFKKDPFLLVMDNQKAVGILSRDALSAYVFNAIGQLSNANIIKHNLYVNRAWPSDTSIGKINKILKMNIPYARFSLYELMIKLLGHLPMHGEQVELQGIIFIFEAQEDTYLYHVRLLSKR